jgi:hypothetical protein
MVLLRKCFALLGFMREVYRFYWKASIVETFRRNISTGFRQRSPEQQLQQQIEAWQALLEKLGGNE